ncbi:MAG: ABC transporter permease [Parasphingorhabdus sp.]|nr:ABC transporter permease [Parasphingorhabdus sp.]
MNEIIRAAFVIARRDFTAIIFSKSFFFFLLGPLFPLLIGVAAGGLGEQVQRDIDRPVIGIALPEAEAQQLLTARDAIIRKLGDGSVPELTLLPPLKAPKDVKDAFGSRSTPLTAILSGSLAKPQLTGARGDVDRWRGMMALLSENATSTATAVDVTPDYLATTGGAEKRSRLATAQGGQIILILLTMILAGMVLSNLVEEKTNKIIEILAAAIPMDAIFLGKLFAMLGMALVGIAVWSSIGFALAIAASSGLPTLPAPAVGWPVFCVLLVLYFSMAYLLLGSLFLGIGAMATTVREVQTLSMPVTMGQLLVFFLAAFSVTKLGQPIEWFAVIFPFSSPFAMIARAAQSDNLWQHGLALLWQGFFTLVIIRFSVMLFRRNVMKSGGGAKRKGLIARLAGR